MSQFFLCRLVRGADRCSLGLASVAVVPLASLSSLRPYSGVLLTSSCCTLVEFGAGFRLGIGGRLLRLGFDVWVGFGRGFVRFLLLR